MDVISDTSPALPKARRTRGLSYANQSNFFMSYHKFLHRSWSNFLHTLNQKTAFWLNWIFKILTKPTSSQLVSESAVSELVTSVANDRTRVW